MKVSLPVVSLVAFAVLAGACSKSKDKEKTAAAGGAGANPVAAEMDKSNAEVAADDAKREPLDVANGEFGAMTIRNAPGGPAELRPMIYNGKYAVSIDKAPKGTRWSAGDLKGELERDNYGMITLTDVTAKFAAMKLASGSLGAIEMTVDPELSLTLDFPKGPKGSFKLPPVMASNELSEMLKRVENGPVTFAGEPVDAKPQENVVLVQMSRVELFGRASVVGDIDMIALSAKLPEAKGEKSCGGYKDNAGKAMPAIKLKLLEVEVTIYDRRSADVVTKKTFAPNSDCPMFAFLSPGQDAMESSEPTKEIESWLKSQVKR